MEDILITTTDSVDNYEVEAYLGVVNANFVAGTGFITDFFASVSDVLGGMSGSYGSEMDRLYERAKWVIAAEAKEKQANAILGYRVDFDEISGKGKSMFMISVTGTAVRLVKKEIVEEKKMSVFEQRYDIYQKLYNLKRFVEIGILTEEQYETEKNHLLLSYEDDINWELITIQDDNNRKSRTRETLKSVRDAKEQKLREMNELLEKQRMQEAENRAKREEAERMQEEKRNNLQKAKEEFLSNVSEIYLKVKLLLNVDLTYVNDILNNLTSDEVNAALYDSRAIDASEKMSFTIGSFIKSHQIAEACKYYMDLVYDDDVVEAKSYVKSVLDIISFTNQSAFEKFALRLIELKFDGQTHQAIVEFMKYAVCDRETAEKVIEIL